MALTPNPFSRCGRRGEDSVPLACHSGKEVPSQRRVRADTNLRHAAWCAILTVAAPMQPGALFERTRYENTEPSAEDMLRIRLLFFALLICRKELSHGR